jgi:glycerophosphoryl diester phosphodiesterase
VNPNLWLIAHRGDPSHAPENTLASFRSAIAKGARAIEADVRRTADGVWVVFHDSSLKRITGISGRVEWTVWRQLATYDAGFRFSPRFRGEPIPRVSDVLALGRMKNVEVFLDVKEPFGQAELLEVIRRFGWIEHVRILASTHDALVRWRKVLPKGHPLFWVRGFRQSVRQTEICKARQLHLSGFVVYRGWVTGRMVERCRQHGLALCVWTIRTVEELKHFARLGATGLMSEVWPPPHDWIG